MGREGIVIQGYKHTWYVIEEMTFEGADVYLLENEVLGDEAPCLIVTGDYEVLLDDVFNGFGDLEEAEADDLVMLKLEAYKEKHGLL